MVVDHSFFALLNPFIPFISDAFLIIYNNCLVNLTLLVLEAQGRIPIFDTSF